jgi:hypothetical protein
LQVYATQSAWCRSLVARAAHGVVACLGFESLGVLDLQEREERTLNAVGGGMLGGLGQSGTGRAGSGARAARLVALTEDLVLITGGFLAGQLALGLGAELRGLALPGALGLLAQRRAVGLGGSASGTADSGSADSLASGAILHLTHFLGASHRAHGFLAVNFTLGALSGLAVHLALRASANRVALGRADRVVTQPLALGVALSRHGWGSQGQNNEGEHELHGDRNKM